MHMRTCMCIPLAHAGARGPCTYSTSRLEALGRGGGGDQCRRDLWRGRRSGVWHACTHVCMHGRRSGVAWASAQSSSAAASSARGFHPFARTCTCTCTRTRTRTYTTRTRTCTMRVSRAVARGCRPRSCRAHVTCAHAHAHVHMRMCTCAYAHMHVQDARACGRARGGGRFHLGARTKVRPIGASGWSPAQAGSAEIRLSAPVRLTYTGGTGLPR